MLPEGKAPAAWKAILPWSIKKVVEHIADTLQVAELADSETLSDTTVSDS